MEWQPRARRSQLESVSETNKAAYRWLKFQTNNLKYHTATHFPRALFYFNLTAFAFGLWNNVLIYYFALRSAHSFVALGFCAISTIVVDICTKCQLEMALCMQRGELRCICIWRLIMAVRGLSGASQHFRGIIFEAFIYELKYWNHEIWKYLRTLKPRPHQIESTHCYTLLPHPPIASPWTAEMCLHKETKLDANGAQQSKAPFFQLTMLPAFRAVWLDAHKNSKNCLLAAALKRIFAPKGFATGGQMKFFLVWISI